MTLNEATELIDTEFGKMVGQANAKRRIKGLILGALMQKGFLPPTLLIAPPGFGKSRFLKVVRGLISTILKKQPLYFKSGAQCGSPVAFFEDVLLPYVNDKDTVIVVDEAHECKKGIMGVLRSLIEITIERTCETVKLGELEMLFNPLRQSVILATNEVDSIPAALMSRVERIDLVPYTDDEMEQILFAGLESFGVRFNENSLRDIARCNRGNARDIVKWVNAITCHVAVEGKTTVNKKDVAAIIRARETYPLGVTNVELQTLLILEKHGEQQLKELAAKTQCISIEQNSNEKYLLQRGLMTIEVKRRLTVEGRAYLASLRADGFIDELPKLAA